MPVESLLSCLPAEFGQAIDQVLADLPVRIGTGWPAAEIGQGLRFGQSLGTVEIGPDFFPARRRLAWDGRLHAVWIYRCLLGESGARGIAGLAAGDKKKRQNSQTIPKDELALNCPFGAR